MNKKWKEKISKYELNQEKKKKKEGKIMGESECGEQMDIINSVGKRNEEKRGRANPKLLCTVCSDQLEGWETLTVFWG